MNALERIEQHLQRTIGIDPSIVGPSRIEGAAQRRRMACGLRDLEAYARRVLVDAVELQELVDAVVVRETYFLRDRAALTALGGMVHSGRLSASLDRPLRVLSVPCSSGEEPYSIAMTLLDAGCAPHTLRIDGVDVSREAVRRARTAVYDARSFRGASVSCLPHFVQTIEGSVPRPDVRGCVRIELGNVLAADFAPPHVQYDVIFCHNLLIYFDATTQQRVISVLLRFLAREGVLFVAAADAFSVRSAGLVPMALSGCAVFRRPETERDDDLAAAGVGARATVRRAQAGLRVRSGSGTALGRRPVSTTGLGSARRPHAAAESAARGISPAGTGVATIGPEAPRHGEIAMLADAGRLEEAARAGDAALASADSDASLFALVGTVHEALGDAERAETCYRRALYLEPTHADALLHFSLLLEQRGNYLMAARLRTRARRAATRDSA
jgi:chemotaxis protein methyltransferase WspC